MHILYEQMVKDDVKRGTLLEVLLNSKADLSSERSIIPFYSTKSESNGWIMKTVVGYVSKVDENFITLSSGWRFQGIAPGSEMHEGVIISLAAIHEYKKLEGIWKEKER